MKKILIFIASFVFSTVLWAQTPNTDYQAQYTKTYKAYVQNPDNVANMMAMAEFYSQTGNPMRNLSMAMKYVRQAEEKYVAMVEDNSQYREVTRLIKKKVTIASVRQLKQHIIEDARTYLADTTTAISSPELNNLAVAFHSDATIMHLIETRRFQMVLSDTRKENTLAAYNAFVKKYKGTTEAEAIEKEMVDLAVKLCAAAQSEAEVDSITTPYVNIEGVKRAAIKRKSTLAYRQVLEQNTVEAYRAFLSHYPSGDEYADALNKLDALLSSEFVTLSTAQEFATFALANSESQLAKQALTRLRSMIRDNQDVNATKVYLKNFPLDEEYNEIYRLYYEWHLADGTSNPIVCFKRSNPNFPTMLALEEDLRKAEQMDKIDLTPRFSESMFTDYTSYIYKLTGKKVSFVALQRTLQQLIASSNWKGVTDRMDYFDLSFDKYCVEECAELRAIVTAPVNKRKHLVQEFTANYDVINAVPQPNGKYLYYTKSLKGITTVGVARQVNSKNRKWEIVGDVKFANSDNKNMQVFSFFDNGKKMLVGSNGNIMIAEGAGTEWKIVEIPPYPVNTDYADYDAYMIPDGSGMLLASDRPDGHNFQESGSYFHGDHALASDIYYIPRTFHGWGEPVNLGLNINGAYCDHSPILSSDLKTLYFITDGRGGLGYGDLYVATRTNVDNWTQWNTPQNYGKETNSPFSETSVAFGENEKTLYLCSNRRAPYFGCYTVDASHSNTNGYKKVEINSPNAEHMVEVYELTAQTMLREEIVSSRHSMALQLYNEKRYVAIPRPSDGSFTPSVVFTPSATSTVSLRSYTEPELRAGCGSIPLPLVTFIDNTAQLLPLAQKELTNTALFAVAHPEFTNIEILVNMPGTDSQHCFDLSRERGAEIKRYLVSQGVDPEHIVVSAYGNVNYQNGKPAAEVSVLF